MVQLNYVDHCGLLKNKNILFIKQNKWMNRLMAQQCCSEGRGIVEEK